MASHDSLTPVRWRDRDVTIETRLIDGPTPDAPLVVFLHEGLGSISMWRDFPQRFCEAVGCRGLVYSRPAYGKSTPRDRDDHWDPDFMHRQAQEVLPALLQALGVKEKPFLLGHSDGGSIALLYAASFPDRVSGVIVLAPHIFVEEVSVTSIAATRQTYLDTDLKSKLARHHDDVDSAFWGWNDIWLDPRFLTWNIESDIEAITAPVLAIQGLDDEYGTLAQIRGIKDKLPQTRLRELPDCGHSPHRDQPQAVIDAAQEFFKKP
jgi:pimeloyl-ACP methyl ester carboxylesterase